MVSCFLDVCRSHNKPQKMYFKIYFFGVPNIDIEKRPEFQLFYDTLKLSCDSRFQHAFSACCCVFKVNTLTVITL
jgi:hypothetical protein